jgi:type 1 fimbria pilin
MKVSVKAISTSLATIALTASVLAWAAVPSVSVPSTPDVDGKVLISGNELAANTNITVRFATDNMAPIDIVVQVAANGTFSIKFTPPINGGYAVTVYDSNGQQIGAGRFGYFR